jgi:hypothetical protein
MKITKEQAESIYSIWCSSEDSKFEWGGIIHGLEYDEDDDVALVDEEGDWVKLVNLTQNSVRVCIYEYTEVEVRGWKL